MPLAREVVSGSARYEGEVLNGMKHGHGILRWDDGDEFVGEFYQDEKVYGSFKWNSGDTYAGEWKDSLPSGKGEYSYKDGRVYRGEWLAGFREGKGVCTWPNGDRFQGTFVKDQMCGVGVRNYADGTCYKGSWLFDAKHGYGTMIWPNGEKLEGCWQSNLLEGFAIFTDAQGNRFEENWVHGSREKLKAALKRTDFEMKKLLESTTAPVWQPDDDATMCFRCDTPFSMMVRRHHCRFDGLVFCDKCTQQRTVISRLATEPVRVCDECFLCIRTRDALIAAQEVVVE